MQIHNWSHLNFLATPHKRLSYYVHKRCEGREYWIVNLYQLAVYWSRANHILLLLGNSAYDLSLYPSPMDTPTPIQLSMDIKRGFENSDESTSSILEGTNHLKIYHRNIFKSITCTFFQGLPRHCSSNLSPPLVESYPWHFISASVIPVTGHSLYPQMVWLWKEIQMYRLTLFLIMIHVWWNVQYNW